ncbi:MAG TPA: Wzz/FepE/Etk N-terminal domain-containing protein, partial [Candidatus Binatia bacterium]|nr:Wzz/FepE/Etk N-terminal domain-containing protein [Candidatus Binatia bacterium]
MEEATRFALRERKAGEALTILPPPAVSWEPAPREPHLLDYLIILRKHQWLILTFALTVVTLVTIATFKRKPVYQASARVEVDRNSQSVLPFQSATDYYQFMDEEDYIETQTKILQSETLALQTIKSMNLGQYPEFGGTGTPDFSQGAAENRPAILGAFLGRLSVKRV